MKHNKSSRSGSVLAETVLLVSIVALSFLILSSVTGFSSNVAGEYTEMGSEVDSLGSSSGGVGGAPVFTITAPIDGGSYPGSTTLTVINGTPGSTWTLTYSGPISGSVAFPLDGSGGFTFPGIFFTGTWTISGTDDTSGQTDGPITFTIT